MNWVASIAIFLFGVFTLDFYSNMWMLGSMLLYSLPLALQFQRSTLVKIWSIWAGFFLIIQSFLSVYLETNNLKKLSPNLNIEYNVKSGYVGLTGIQKITTDSKGFRTTTQVDYTNDENYRIFIIGGSTTEQILIDDKQTWPHLLQKALSNQTNQKIEVINTGVSGLRVKHHLATFKYIQAYNPNLIIFLFGVNDWNWHIEQEKNASNYIKKINAAREKFMLRNTILGISVISIKNNSNSEVQETQTISVTGTAHEQFRGSINLKNKFSFLPTSVHPEFKEYLFKISQRCKSTKTPCVFLTQPHGYSSKATLEFKNSFWMTPPRAKYTLSVDNLAGIADLYNNYLIEFTKSNQHVLCDIAPELSPSFKHFLDDCHFNPEGSQKVAQLVKQCLSTKLFKN